MRSPAGRFGGRVLVRVAVTKASVAKAAMVGALLLSACGGGEGADSEAAELTFTDSPISRALGVDFSNQSGSQDQFAEQTRVAEEQIVECMAAEGFDYVAQTQSFEAVNDPFEEAMQLEPREFAEQHGWGVATLSGFDQAFAVGQEFTDPNQDYVGSLSDSERDAYFAVLHGAQPDIDFENSTEDEINEAFENFEPTGCNSIAYEQIFSGENSVFGIYDELSDVFEDMWDKVTSDPRVVEFNTNWQTCIGESGYDYSSQEDAMQSLGQRSQELFESATFAGDGLTEADFEGMSDDELDAIFSQPPDFDEELQAEIRADEIAFALVALDCGMSPPFLGPPQVLLEVQFELEQAIVDENQEVFDRYRELGN